MFRLTLLGDGLYFRTFERQVNEAYLSLPDSKTVIEILNKFAL